MKKIKKYLITINVLFLMLLTGCSARGIGLYVLNVILADDEEDEEDEEDGFIIISRDEIEKKALQEGQAIKEAFIDKDADKIKSLFSTRQKNKYNIKYQAEKAFDILDGNIISTGEVSGYYCHGESNFGAVLKEYDGEIRDVVTDQGKSYTISYYGVYYDKYHEDRLGMILIQIFDNDAPPEELEEDSKYNVVIGG